MKTGLEDRKYWIKTLTHIIDAPLEAAEARQLKIRMPKSDPDKWERANKDKFAYLELAGRLLCGVAPWIETPKTDPIEESLRVKYARLCRELIDAITDPTSPDRVDFFVTALYGQSLVDAAFLSHAIIRAKTELYDKLPGRVKKNLISCLTETRRILPAHNNWMLFSGMVEAALHAAGEQADVMRIDACVFQHEQWYKGDGVYGDGASFHWDYYNSYVIQPMLVDILRVARDILPDRAGTEKRYETALKRAGRYAAVLEMLVAPDGTFPPVGRSITYRTGAFQMLAQAALEGIEVPGASPAQIRAALTKVIRRCFDSPENFRDGWLTVGLCGEQPSLGELYICTGSLYLCTAGFLPLGLDASHPFWSDDGAMTTSELIWSGGDRPADHSI